MTVNEIIRQPRASDYSKWMFVQPAASIFLLATGSQKRHVHRDILNYSHCLLHSAINPHRSYSTTTSSTHTQWARSLFPASPLKRNHGLNHMLCVTILVSFVEIHTVVVYPPWLCQIDSFLTEMYQWVWCCSCFGCRRVAVAVSLLYTWQASHSAVGKTWFLFQALPSRQLDVWVVFSSLRSLALNILLLAEFDAESSLFLGTWLNSDF